MTKIRSKNLDKSTEKWNNFGCTKSSSQ